MLAEHDWTVELVGDRLRDAFAMLPGLPVYSPARGDFRSLAGQPLRGLLIITVAQAVLGRKSAACIVVLTWARHRAGGGALNDLLAEMGWREKTFKRVRRAALQRIADHLNRERERLAGAPAPAGPVDIATAMLGPVAPAVGERPRKTA